MAEQLEILGLPQSNYVWATRIAAAYKGVDHVHHTLEPHSPEILKISPLGKIPAMRHRDVTLFESAAICRYIDRTFEGPTLFRNASSDAWLSAIQTSLEPILVRQYLFAYLFAGEEGPNREAIDAVLPKVRASLDTLEDAIREEQIGDGFDVVDAYLIPILAYLQRAPESGEIIQKSKVLSAYLKRGLERECVRATMPEV